MAWQEPKTDWVANPKSPMSEDFNRIESNIDFLKGDIETKKGAIVDALNTVGLASELTDTHATLASRIAGANQGTRIITPSTANQTIAKGFHSGSGYVQGDANLIGDNIKSGVSIFGVSGGIVPVPGGTTRLIGEGNVAWVKGIWGHASAPYRITTNRLGINDPSISLPTGGYEFSLATDDMIDLTNVQRVYIEVTEARGACYFIVSTSKGGDSGVYTSRITIQSGNKIAIDVSALSGDHYLRVHLITSPSSSGHMQIIISRIWLLI